jgi:hypothetical protein
MGMIKRRYRLVLWCEHTGHWHPWYAASYSLDQPRDWLVRIGPYASLVFKALRLVIPVAVAVTDMALTNEQLQHAQLELEAMTILAEGLPDQLIEVREEAIASEYVNQLTPAQGQAARALRIALFEHDHMRAFGDLRRVQAPSGDFLWVCAEHYPEYDPGLPSIPESGLENSPGK